METVKRNRKIWWVMMSLLVLFSLPVMTSAQGRGRGQEKKLDRFVNGHDARDGRWDGRGPRYGRRSNVGNEIWRQRQNRQFRDRQFERNNRWRDRRLEMRSRGVNNNNFLRSQRLRNRYRRNRNNFSRY
jgi:hypothetical protein